MYLYIYTCVYIYTHMYIWWILWVFLLTWLLVWIKATPEEWSKVGQILSIMKVKNDDSGSMVECAVPSAPPIPASWSGKKPGSSSSITDIVPYDSKQAQTSQQPGGWSQLPSCQDFFELAETTDDISIEPTGSVVSAIALQACEQADLRSDIELLGLDHPEVVLALTTMPHSAAYQAVTRVAKGYQSKKDKDKEATPTKTTKNKAATPAKIIKKPQSTAQVQKHTLKEVVRKSPPPNRYQVYSKVLLDIFVY